MEYFLICFILCVAGVQNVWGQAIQAEINSPLIPTPEQAQVYVKECAEELDMPVYKNEHIYKIFEAITYFYPGPKTDKMTCMTTCLARKQSEFEGLTLYKRMHRDIDFVYQLISEDTKGTREEIKSKVDSCYAKESNECEFFKCLEVMKPPFRHLSTSFVKHFIIRAIHSGFQ